VVLLSSRRFMSNYDTTASFQILYHMGLATHVRKCVSGHVAALGPGVYSASNRNEYQENKNNVSGE
jgi:hypothetical protein